MPPPFKVELLPHNPQWAERSFVAQSSLALAIGPALLTVHHVGSTAIPGMHAKPILDLVPVVTSLSELDRRARDLERLGYEWWGELGLPGRRYCTKSDPETGRRIIQLHCYVNGSPDVGRHLAFRDDHREHPETAKGYD